MVKKQLSYMMTTADNQDPRFKDMYLFHGKSAYQSAVEYGFVGTEAEWVMSLREIRFSKLEEFKETEERLLYVDMETGWIHRFDLDSESYIPLYNKTIVLSEKITVPTIEGITGNITTVNGKDVILTNSISVPTYTGTDITIDGTLTSPIIKGTTSTITTMNSTTGNITTVNGKDVILTNSISVPNLITDIKTRTIEPTTTDMYTLGSSTLKWKNIYASNANIDAISGVSITLTSKLDVPTINGTSYNGKYIELSNTTPYIDFHYNSASDDYTSRIIESASGVLSINSVRLSNNTVTATTFTGALKGNADTATILQTTRRINVGTAVTATATEFNGDKDITIPITAINPSYVTQSASYRFVTDTQIAAWNDKPTQTQLAADIKTAIDNVINAAPGVLDTLDELAGALGDDPNFATTMATS